MRTFAITAICLTGCFNAGGADNPGTSPSAHAIEAAGTASLSPQCQQRLGLPEKISFEFKGNVEAKPVPEKAGTSRAVVKYSLVVRDAATAQVHLDLNTAFTLESQNPPGVVQMRACEAVVRSAAAVLGYDTETLGSTNFMNGTINLKMMNVK